MPLEKLEKEPIACLTISTGCARPRPIGSAIGAKIPLTEHGSQMRGLKNKLASL